MTFIACYSACFEYPPKWCTCVCVCLFICLLFYVSACLPLSFLNIHQYWCTCECVCLFTCLLFCVSVCLSFLNIHRSGVHVNVCSVYLLAFLCLCLSVSIVFEYIPKWCIIFLCQCVCLFICLLFYVSVCLSPSLSLSPPPFSQPLSHHCFKAFICQVVSVDFSHNYVFRMAKTNDTDLDFSGRYEPFEFLEVQPELYIVLVTVLVFASVVGTCGNVLILVAIATQRNLQNVESVFVVNLACCDLYVTLIADPLSIVGKLESSLFCARNYVTTKLELFVFKDNEFRCEGDV